MFGSFDNFIRKIPVVGDMLGAGDDDEPPSPGAPPTAADIYAQNADKARLRRQRAAAIIAQGRRGTILSGPLGIPGSATKGGSPSGTNTLLGM
jgi:hypothetical protein